MKAGQPAFIFFKKMGLLYILSCSYSCMAKTKYLPNPLALTTVTKSAYRSMLKDAELPMGKIAEKYGAGWVFRMQGIMCAFAVHHCAKDAKGEGIPYKGAMGLYRLVAKFDYGTYFEDNHLENIKPKDATLSMMMFAMCQAETGDYGDGE